MGGRGIDGAILIDPLPGDEFALALAEAGLPAVTLGRSPDLPQTPRVDQDFREAMDDVLGHLREQSYERPAFLSIPEHISSTDDMKAAFVELTSDRVVAIARDYSDDAARVSASAALTAERPPDAFICATERQAIGVYRAAADLGLRIPADVGVVSFGESTLARGFKPPVTAICLFPEQSGQELVYLMTRILAGEEVPAVTLVSTELLIRPSSLRPF